MRLRHRALAATSIVSCSVLTFGAASWGQASPPGSPSLEASGPVTAAPSAELQEVVVTARKRVESLQRVPVAVTALNATQLAQNRVVNIQDLGQLTPSLTFQQESYSTFGSLVGIRGQKTGDTILSETPSIGIYIDDVYSPSTFGTGVNSLYDTRAIEVLKGPQGTLYGRNTTGGALKIESNPADYSGYHGSAQVGAGNYGSNEENFAVNLPLVTDKAALRVVLQHQAHDGYAYDNTNHRPVDNVDSYSGRFELRLDPVEKFEATIRGNYADGRSGGVIANLEAVKPPFTANGTPTFSPALLNVGLETGAFSFGDLLPFLTGGTPTPAQTGAVFAGQQTAYNDLTKYLRQGYSVNYSYPEADRVKDAGLSLNATYHINDHLSVKDVTSYQYAYQYGTDDVDGNPYQTLEGIADVTSLDQLTQEVQVSGDALSRKLQYTAGVYYYQLVGNDNSPGELELPYLNVTGSPVDTYDHLRDTSEAVYGQASYEIIPHIRLTGGLRYTSEDTELLTTSTAGPAGACNVPPPAGVGGAACLGDFKNSFTNLSYTAGIDWQITPDDLVYFRTSRGFKAGGQNQRGSTVGGYDSFAPETVTDYEVGLKTEFFQHRLRIDADYYHSDYSNIQRTVLEVTPDDQTITEIKNAAAATINGAELETTFRPVRWLVLQANGAYTYPSYQSYLSDGVDLSHDKFLDQPRWQGNISATFTKDLTLVSQEALFTATVNQTYQSSVSLAPDNTSIYDNNYSVQHGYGLLDGRVALNFRRYDLTVEGYVKNLTDRKYKTGATDLTDALGVGIVYLSDPRTYGFSVSKKF